jgi:hypothetical protein
MKTGLPLLGCLLLAFGAQAQGQPAAYRHAFGVGLERVGLDAPDAVGNRYLLRYARHLHHDRLVVAANLGYLSVRNRVYLPGAAAYYVEGKRRQRVTTDFTAAFDFIRQPRHALRLGAGPSLWYRQEELSDGIHYTSYADGSVANVRATWRSEKAVAVGLNLLLEYEYALTDHLLLSGNVKFVDLGKGGQSASYGGGLGYRLP